MPCVLGMVCMSHAQPALADTSGSKVGTPAEAISSCSFQPSPGKSLLDPPAPKFWAPSLGPTAQLAFKSTHDTKHSSMAHSWAPVEAEAKSGL